MVLLLDTSDRKLGRYGPYTLAAQVEQIGFAPSRRHSQQGGIVHQISVCRQISAMIGYGNEPDKTDRYEELLKEAEEQEQQLAGEDNRPKTEAAVWRDDIKKSDAERDNR